MYLPLNLGTYLVFHGNYAQWNSIQPFLNIAHKIVSNYIIIFLKVIWWRKICKFSSGFSWKHKINKSNTKISKHYWIICLYSKNICFYFFITVECSDLFWNIFYSKIIKISNIIILYAQSNPMSSNIRVLIKIYYISPILYFG